MKYTRVTVRQVADYLRRTAEDREEQADYHASLARTAPLSLRKTHQRIASGFRREATAFRDLLRSVLGP